jgi:hypothetical protein
MTRDSKNIPVVKGNYRSWVSTRMHELKREHPSRSKSDCWRAAQSEWNELWRQHKREQKRGKRVRYCLARLAPLWP